MVGFGRGRARRALLAFYQPLVADLSNHGSWLEAGGFTSTERATKVWKATLNEFTLPTHSASAVDRMAPYIEAAIARGGSAPSGG